MANTVCDLVLRLIRAAILIGRGAVVAVSFVLNTDTPYAAAAAVTWAASRHTVCCYNSIGKDCEGTQETQICVDLASIFSNIPIEIFSVLASDETIYLILHTNLGIGSNWRCLYLIDNLDAEM